MEKKELNLVGPSSIELSNDIEWPVQESIFCKITDLNEYTGQSFLRTERLKALTGLLNSHLYLKS
jgi:hypothetical protein